MRIGYKLLIGLIVIFSLMAFNAWSAVHIMNGIDSDVEGMMDNDYESVLASEHMITALFDVNLQESYYLAMGQQVYLEYYNRSKVDFFGWYDDAQAMVVTPQERAILNNVSVSFVTYDGYHQQIVHLYDSGNVTEANDLSLGASNGEFYKIYNSLLELESLNTKSLDASYVNVRDSMETGVALQRFLSVVSLVIAIIFGVVTSGSITSSIGALSRGAEKVGHGELGYQTNVQTKDELGELSMTFNQMSIRLRDREAELRKKNEQIEGANEELKKLDTMKTVLLANVSHELRTPLTSIKGHIEVVLDEQVGPINDGQREMLSFADKDTDHLNRLIEELLTVSVIESGNLRLQRAGMDLEEVVRWCLERLDKDLNQKGIRAEVKMEPGPPPILADRDKIVQVISNILRNAINFSPRDSTITIEAGTSAGQVETRIRDEGIGIPASSLDRVFDRFYQVDSNPTRQVGGTGLGLYICKGIVEAHGGRIWAESTLGKGTTIAFRLPIGNGV